MKNYTLLNEIVLQENIDVVDLMVERMITKQTREIVINTSINLIKYLLNNREISGDFYELYYVCIERIEAEYNCSFDDVYIDEAVISIIEETISEFIDN